METVLTGMLLNVPDPVLNVFKALFIRYVVNEHDPHGAAVIGRCYGAESLLARGVPVLVKIGGFTLKIVVFLVN